MPGVLLATVTWACPSSTSRKRQHRKSSAPELSFHVHLLADQTPVLAIAKRGALTGLKRWTQHRLLGVRVAGRLVPRRLPLECLAGSAVEGHGEGVEILGAPAGKVRCFGEVLAQHPVRVCVHAALPRAVRSAKMTAMPCRS